MGVGLDRRNLDVPVTPALHDLAGAEHNADTIGDLSAKVSDADLIDEADARIPVGEASKDNGAAVLAFELTPGGVLFTNGDKKVGNDALGFFYDALTSFLGIGTDSPGTRLHVNGDVTVDNLAGIGERNVKADANGMLIIGP